MKTSLRELPFYSTILSVLAENEPKLNYLFTRTGFSRAKISVYIKNLIQIDVAEKIFSYEPEKAGFCAEGAVWYYGFLFAVLVSVNLSEFFGF